MSSLAVLPVPKRAFGVTAHLPVKGTELDWKRARATLAKLPTCTIREDLLFWEVSWAPGVLDTRILEKRLGIIARSGHNLVLNVVPHPHPSSQPWQNRLAKYPKRVPWVTWHRPPYPLWEPIQHTLQKQINWVSDFWMEQGRGHYDLTFEWINEPATGYVSGGPKSEPEGLWSQAFHAFCNHILLADGGIDWQGHLLLGPTLSFWDKPGQEKVGFASVEGGSGARWWEKIDCLSLNSAVYLPASVKKDPAQIAERTFQEIDRRIRRMKRLDLPAASHEMGLHEWYVTKETVGVGGALDPLLRAECIEAIGEKLKSHPDLWAIFFYCLFNTNSAPKTIEESKGFRRYEHSCESGPAFRALTKFLRP